MQMQNNICYLEFAKSTCVHFLYDPC